MKIKIENLKTFVKIFENLLENYQNNYLNFYNEIKGCSTNWKDSHSNYFFNNIDNEKKENTFFYDEMIVLKNIYIDIIKEYEDYGNDIYFNLNDQFLTEFNNYISQLNTTINYYKDIDASFSQQEYNLIEKQRNLLLNNKNELFEIKERYKNIYNKINNSEEVIKRKLIELDITEINENSTRNRTLGTTDTLYMEIDKISNSIKKLKYYIQEEDIIFEELNELFKNVYYDTKNKENLEELKSKIINKYKIINNNHKNNIEVLVNNNNYYIQSRKELENIIWR